MCSRERQFDFHKENQNIERISTEKGEENTVKSYNPTDTKEH